MHTEHGVMELNTEPGDARRLLAGLRARGWSAPEAFEMYSAWTRVAAPMWVATDEPSRCPNTRALWLRRAQARALAVLETPQGFRRHAAGLHGAARNLLGLPFAPSRNRGPMTWGELDALPDLDRLRRPPAPISGLTVPEAACVLSEALNEVGLRAFSWPAAEGACPDEMIRMADDVRRVNRELALLTGWSGPLLGLAGRTALHLGAEYEWGGMCEMGGWPEVMLSPDTVWGLMAHEWIHMLDGAMGPEGYKSYGMLNSLGSQTPKRGQEVVWARCWGDLLEGLRNPGLSASEHRRLAREAWVQRADRWQFSPLLRAALDAEIAASRRAGWDRREARVRLLSAVEASEADVVAWFPQNCRTVPLTGDGPECRESRADRMLSEVEVLSACWDGQVLPSLWLAYRDRMDAATARRPGSPAVGYLGRPEEQAAFSFQTLASEKKEILLSGVIGRPQSPAWLDFPLPTELAVHRKLWARFFEQARSWWDTWCRDARPRSDAGSARAALQPAALRSPEAEPVTGWGVS